MKYQKLGKSELSVSRIGFGCMSLKGTEFENILLLHKAQHLGINFFDTADIYDNGRNEEHLGKAFKNCRDKVIIATKAGNRIKKRGQGLEWDASKKHILEAAEASLKRLQTDYIDLYQLHGGTIGDPINETIEAFELLKSQGKIRHYGISSIRPNVIREYVNRSSIISVMMQYSLLDRRPEESVFDLLQNSGIGVLVRGGLAQGLLVDKAAKEYLGYNSEEVQKVSETVGHVSNENRSKSQTAIGFCLANSAVTAVIAGIRTEKQLIEAAAVFDTVQLETKELELLKRSLHSNKYEQHR